MRAVLDANVLISALISRAGASSTLVVGWLNGRFELVVSEKLLDELSRALAYPRVEARVSRSDASAFIQLLRDSSTVAPDPPDEPRRSRDPGDDYLIALAERTASILVSGDDDLLSLAPALPVMAPAEFVQRLGGREGMGAQ